MGYRGMGPMGNLVQGVWATWVMGHMGNGVLRVWGIWAMRPTWGMGYRGMGHMGNRAQGYGVQGVWATWTMGYMGNGVQGYGTHGQWGPWVIYSQNNKKMSSCQKDVKLSKKCQMSKNQAPRLWRRFTKKIN